MSRRQGCYALRTMIDTAIVANRFYLFGGYDGLAIRRRSEAMTDAQREEEVTRLLESWGQEQEAQTCAKEEKEQEEDTTTERVSSD